MGEWARWERSYVRNKQIIILIMDQQVTESDRRVEKKRGMMIVGQEGKGPGGSGRLRGDGRGKERREREQGVEMGRLGRERREMRGSTRLKKG